MFATVQHYQLGSRFSVLCNDIQEATEIAVDVVSPYAKSAWQFVSSDEALDLYAYVIVFLTDVAVLSGKLAIAAGRDLRRWSDTFVDDCLEPEQPKAIAVLPVAPVMAVQAEVAIGTESTTPVVAKTRHGDEFVGTVKGRSLGGKRKNRKQSAAKACPVAQ